MEKAVADKKISRLRADLDHEVVSLKLRGEDGETKWGLEKRAKRR